MSEIECKYKYQYIEKFNGEKYCLCFNDLCKNLSFACDKNCQIFEDYKQLQQAKKTQMELLAKVDTLEKEKEFWCDKSVRFEEFVDKLVEEKDKLKADVEKAKKYNYDAGQQLIRMSQELQQLKTENESYEYQLQKRIEICDSWMCVANKYKATLDEIEGICDFNYTKENTRILANEILQLIKKAKESEE